VTLTSLRRIAGGPILVATEHNRGRRFNVLKIYSARHPTEAHLLKGILESYGIACEVKGESLYGARGGVPITSDTDPSVWICDDSQWTEATAIVREFENPEAADRETWVCESCGEESEGQFTECWNCGRPRG
jgi:hypothetical protein